MTPLCELSRKYGTDKGGVMEPTPNHRANLFHDYTPIYYDLMKDWASEAWNILEVGIAEGRSARMWAEFFPNARIFCFDIEDKAVDSVLGENRIHPISCDQSKIKSLKKALKNTGVDKFDYIIDDGSHVFNHQVTTMAVLLPALRPQGIYFIEDCINSVEQIPVPAGWTNYVCRWHDRPHSMLQVIRRAP
jgi:hypothetical protein